MQERAILLLRSETGKHEDFAQQREVFFNICMATGIFRLL